MGRELRIAALVTSWNFNCARKFDYPVRSSKLYLNFVKPRPMFVLNSNNSIANQFLFELRDSAVQKDRLRFRKNLERLGEILAYELSKALKFRDTIARSPLGNLSIRVLEEQPVLITIMRAGLPFFQGFLNFFDGADSGFIGAFRKEEADNLTIKLEYVATTSLEGKTVILIDPMLATGRSIIDSVNAICRNGKPAHIHIASLVAAPEGIKHLEQNLQLPYTLWACALDERLNEQFYIVPGLGDAGDLSFGEKL
jgi:uracil phosphoribosyltransferase